MKLVRNLVVSAIATVSLVGCADMPIPIVPFPVMKMGPDVTSIPEEVTQEQALIDSLIDDENSIERRGVVRIALRNGTPIAHVPRKPITEILQALPSSDLRKDSLKFYVPPPTLSVQAEGKNHYYNFKIDNVFATARDAYLNGHNEESVKILEGSLSNYVEGTETDAEKTRYYWRSSYMKALNHMLLGQSDLMETELKRTEQLEKEAMEVNISSRALRAESRLWSGDYEGAIKDAASVVQVLGKWRLPTAYGSPPLDQIHLANSATAQVRSQSILSWALISLGQYDEALKWSELANQNMNNVMFVNRHPLYGLYFPAYDEILYGRAFTLTGLGSNLLILDPDSARAQESFKHAIEYFDALGYAFGRVMVETFKAKGYFIAGRYEQAANQAKIGLNEAEKAGLHDYIWRLELMRGKSLLKIGRIEEAEKSLRNAQAIVDLMVGTMGSDSEKIRFGGGKEEITTLLTQIDVQNGDINNLFTDLERGRARAFVSLLANRAVASGQQEKIIDQVRELDKAILLERQRKNSLTATRSGGVAEEGRLLRERDTLLSELRKKDPKIADAFQVKAESLSHIQQKLSPGEAMVYYFGGYENGRIHQLVIEHNKAQTNALAVEVKELKNTLSAFTNAVYGMDEKGQAQALSKFDRWLGTDDWADYKRVYIVASGDLHFLPWGGLNTNTPIAALPTAGWVTQAKGGAGSQLNDIVLVGDPNFGGKLPQLSGARAEARSLAKLYNTSALIGNSATEINVRGAVGERVGVLHLATHALYDPVFPLKSAVFLTDGKTALPVTAEKLFANPIKADLVVLSACETGMGDVAAGDDLMGLSRSFYLGGARAIISTLWPVADEPTKTFMEVFHKEAQKGDFGSAWVAARNKLKAQGMPPAFYAPFVLGGSFGNTPG